MVHLCTCRSCAAQLQPLRSLLLALYANDMLAMGQLASAPCRLVLINAPGFFSLLWKICEPVMPVATRSKVIVVSKKVGYAGCAPGLRWVCTWAAKQPYIKRTAAEALMTLGCPAGAYISTG